MELHNIIKAELLKQLDTELIAELEQSTSQEELINILVSMIVESKINIQTKEEILKLFKIPKQRFEHLIRENKIPHIYINNKTRLFNANDVYKYLNENCKIAS
ncbi:MAG: hypothetical protein WC667_04850 [Sulfurimonas sp.]|jgi:hypothetical protein